MNDDLWALARAVGPDTVHSLRTIHDMELAPEYQELIETCLLVALAEALGASRDDRLTAAGNGDTMAAALVSLMQYADAYQRKRAAGVPGQSADTIMSTIDTVCRRALTAAGRGEG